MVNQCLDANPEKRPSGNELWNEITGRLGEKYEEFIDANEIFSQESPSEAETNPEAIYTSRYMSFTNLSKPINSIGVKIEDPEGIKILILIVFIHILIFRYFLFQFQIHN